MNDNIFVNAYFGKAYKTRDGRKAIYLGDSKIDSGMVHVVYEGSTYSHTIMKDGHYWATLHTTTNNDIVSEWQDHINEKELDEIASIEFYKDQSVCYTELDIYKAAFKAAYRKSMEEKL